MEQFALYLVLKELCKEMDTSYKYSFNDMDSNADNVVGIYIKGAEPSEYRTVANGEYHNIINRVQFLIQGGICADSLMNSLRLGSNIKHTLIKTFNKYIIVPSKLGINTNGEIKVVGETEGEVLESFSIVLTKVDMLSDLVNIGKSEQGRPRYSINFKIKYEIGGK